MSTKAWKNLSTILTDALNASNVDEETVQSVIQNLSEKKSEVLKSMSNSLRKRVKDPNAPKKSKSGYIFFCTENRDKIKASDPDLKATDITKRLGADWKALPEKSKKRYNAMAEKDKARYATEMESYVPTVPEVSEDSGNGKKTKRGPKQPRTGPKRALSAYLYFCTDARAAIKEEENPPKGRDLTTELGRRWAELSAEDRQKYEQMHLDDKNRYEAEKSQASGAEAQPASGGKAKASKAKSNGKTATPPAQTASAGKATKGKGKTAEAPVAGNGKAKASKGKEVVAEAPAVASKATKGKGKATKEAPVPAKASGKAKAVKEVPKSAGMSYYMDEEYDAVKEAHPDWTDDKVNKHLTGEWNKMTADEREQYDVAANENDMDLIPEDD